MPEKLPIMVPTENDNSFKQFGITGLLPGGSPEAMQENIRTLQAAGVPEVEAIKIALAHRGNTVPTNLADIAKQPRIGPAQPGTSLPPPSGFKRPVGI